eukprot:jgi/Chlat1/1528/Chrsp122S01819
MSSGEMFGKGEDLQYTKEIHFADQPLVPHMTPEWLAAYSQRYPLCSDSCLADGVSGGLVDDALVVTTSACNRVRDRARYVMDSTHDFLRTLSAALQIGQHYSRHGLVAGLKFMVTPLRNPVERTLSWFGHKGRLLKHIPCDVQFNDWARQVLSEARTCMAARTNLPKPWVYEECRPSPLWDSWYAVQLDPWWSLFPPQKQFINVDFHKLVYEREAVMSVLDYLGIEYELPLPDRVVHNKPTSILHVCATYPAPTMSNNTHAMLVEFFQPLNAQLGTLFERLTSLPSRATLSPALRPHHQPDVDLAFASP